MNKVKLSNRSIEISYKDAGEGIPVILLHGFCGSSSYWDAVIPLLQSQCRLIVPDLPGHGKSGVPQSPYPIEAFADDMADLLQQLNIGKAVWLGHSLGGYVTLAAVERHADRVGAFGLIHSTAYPDDEKGKEGRLKAIQTVLDSGIVPFVEGLVPKLFAPEHVESMSDKVEEAKTIGYATPPEGAVVTLEAMRGRPDRNEMLRKSACPVILVAGENDQIIKPDKTFSVHSQSIQHVLLNKVGHMSMMEHPNQLADKLAAFLKTIQL
jgi:pimeloyl-ACP methyl ester carboxylesterase